MSSDDPFSQDNDRTVLRPMPGGRRSDVSSIPGSIGNPQQQTPQQAHISAQPFSTEPVSIQGAANNPLINSSATLFSLAVQLRGSMTNADPESLKARIASEIQKFETEARNLGVVNEHVMAAKYALCTLLDETVMNTPWGSTSQWSEQSLLSIYFQETWGGEKFFELIDRAIAEPVRNLLLLEFLYVCLALGFEGKYGVVDHGRTKLEEIRENLYRLLRTHTGDYERDLSPNWRNSQNKGGRLIKYVPLWVVAAISGVLLLSIYVVFNYFLSTNTAPVLMKLEGIGYPETQTVIEK